MVDKKKSLLISYFIPFILWLLRRINIYDMEFLKYLTVINQTLYWKICPQNNVNFLKMKTYNGKIKPSQGSH